MADYKLAQGEAGFADLVWENEPINSGELAKLSENKLKWKKSTTYTVLKKLCDKGIFKNENSIVSSVLKKEEFVAKQSRKFVDDIFDGSLPKFIATFIGRKKLSDEQAEELKRLIDEYRED